MGIPIWHKGMTRMSERKTSEQKLEVRRPDALTAEEDQALLTDMKAASALMLAELIRRYGTQREGGMELKNCTGYAFAPVLSETEIAAYLDHHAVEPSSAWHPVPPAVCLQSGFWLTFSYSAHHIARMFLISTRAANPALAKPDQAMQLVYMSEKQQQCYIGVVRLDATGRPCLHVEQLEDYMPLDLQGLRYIGQVLAAI